MSATFITLQQAAKLAGKSVQTIRRSIKAKKLVAKRKKTPQGFNYLIDRDSLINVFEIEETKAVIETAESTPVASNEETSKALKSIERQYGEVKDLFQNFNKTMQTLIEHNNQERENFYRLMKTFQDRVVMLEDSVRVLNEKKSKKWYKLWS